MTNEVKSDYGSDIDVTNASDYGSEFDIEDATLIGELLMHIAASAPKTVVYPSIEISGDSDADGPTVVVPEPSSRHKRSASVEVEYDRPSRQSFSIPREEPVREERPKSRVEGAAAQAGDYTTKDARSPLERFRTKPKKCLSVTDLVSPAWCELQYWYNLTKFGRKPRTQAMKQGSKVHKVLEDQVHEIVPVQVTTKEDRFGLRIWNIIQGLRTLKTTGLTRELEIWGLVDGQVVNGIIDEISYTCPDPELEEALEKKKLEKAGGTLPLGQLGIQESFANAGSGGSAWIGGLEKDRMVYIADVKTRGVRNLPTGASLRPTWMQLMIYRKILESLALNTVDAETVFSRYDVQPLESFTDQFMAEIEGIDIVGDLDTANPFAILQASEIQSHNNLSALWSLMISEFSETIDTFSDILRAEFRFAKTGEIIGNEFTTYDAAAIDNYVGDELKWWRGSREAKGVEIEEAFKCRVCDFAEECSWRKTKIEEATEKHRLRAKSRGKSAV
ncbi:hypothetical protein P154DRAFT_542366 [Amniculicola lignicola CBS 123094]|uniref:Exonuclease V n=1 Tax=Amniculicola lignicola CBS 123094 TaxID=1392246 RepID=A0A6A5X045_9PLEO|nr:hypothetical protein P154DRAFT_542366 [Amniculicola lignicola CBS 123094]